MGPMWQELTQSAAELMQRGGPIMWPLLAMSLLAVTLIVERLWFWLATHRPGRLARLRRVEALIAGGELTLAAELYRDDRSVYGRMAQAVLTARQEGRPIEPAAAAALDAQRARLERFMPTLSTLITAAPMVGILGTVVGIIASFQILAAEQTTTDPRVVSQGIAEALLTTAAGLLIAIVVLFPYNAFRAQAERALGRLEHLVLAVAARGDASEASSAKAAPVDRGA
jgi:biopolymer transport protein ExbB